MFKRIDKQLRSCYSVVNTMLGTVVITVALFLVVVGVLYLAAIACYAFVLFPQVLVPIGVVGTLAYLASVLAYRQYVRDRGNNA